ncbi:MAG: gliding motility lipoprotein GldD [Raineya sp.]|nr:gliding motility lipoprotein GldD [Raineya sp.]MDW8296048.1 gliding motility lipoprotein GldD [Raineya sp.]
MSKLNIFIFSGVAFTAVILLTFFWWKSQNEEAQFTPKPKGYNRILLPKNEYRPLPDTFPYTFEYSKEAIIRPDSSHLAERYWIHVIYPKLGKSEIQITYKNISDNPTQKLAELIDDSHRLASKHLYRAEALKYYEYKNAQNLPVLAIGFEGEIPSHLQFYTTDSVKHFLRAAIYFRTANDNDSLAPVIEFVKRDMLRMIATQKFK